MKKIYVIFLSFVVLSFAACEVDYDASSASDVSDVKEEIIPQNAKKKAFWYGEYYVSVNSYGCGGFSVPDINFDLEKVILLCIDKVNQAPSAEVYEKTFYWDYWNGIKFLNERKVKIPGLIATELHATVQPYSPNQIDLLAFSQSGYLYLNYRYADGSYYGWHVMMLF